jgi:hypothetical protein
LLVLGKHGRVSRLDVRSKRGTNRGPDLCRRQTEHVISNEIRETVWLHLKRHRKRWVELDRARRVPPRDVPSYLRSPSEFLRSHLAPSEPAEAPSHLDNASRQLRCPLCLILPERGPGEAAVTAPRGHRLCGTNELDEGASDQPGRTLFAFPHRPGSRRCAHWH